MSVGKIGIIGGSGLDNPDILQDRQEVAVPVTPFGASSDGSVVTGTIAGVPCVLLSRHGRKHDIMPTNVNYRANIYTLKQCGCTHLIVTTACGSLQEEYPPGHIVFIDDFIDRTSKRPSTFFDGSSKEFKGVCHLPMTDIFSLRLRALLKSVSDELGYKSQLGGTMVTIEGPRFSTPAESRMFRSWGGQLINMSSVPEAVLANEAGMTYASIAMVTDYDCWRESEEVSSVEQIIATFTENAHKAVNIIKQTVPLLAKQDWSQEQETRRNKVKQNIL